MIEMMSIGIVIGKCPPGFELITNNCKCEKNLSILLTLFLPRMEKMIIYDQFFKKSFKIVDKVSSHEKITVCWRVILLPINRKKKLTSH